MGGMSEDERIIRNLEDADCDEDTIKRFFCLQKDGRRREQYRLLSRQRALLLEQVHSEQHKIDCLDYLVYTMKNKNSKTK